jgi:hypothetical protein
MDDIFVNDRDLQRRADLAIVSQEPVPERSEIGLHGEAGGALR